MAKFEVTLAKSATYIDMATGTKWKRDQTRTLDESEAARYKVNPKFVIKEVAAKPKTKPVAKTDEGDGEGEGLEDVNPSGDQPPKPAAKKKAAAKKKTAAKE